MKKISIFMLHPYAKDVNSTLKYLQLEELKDDYQFVWDPVTPDYLIISELIYNSNKIKKQFARLFNSVKIIIFFSREAVSPDFNLCDYAISFDSFLNNGDRYVQLPGPFDLYPAFVKNSTNNIVSKGDWESELSKKKRFCNFLYSNSNAHPNRDRLFYILSKYKRVDSLGKHLNNVDSKGTGYQGHEMDCVSIKSPYKFSIAAENAVFDGYTSEKILTSLSAHTVPIYFGDPRIEDIINPDCFINANKLTDIGDVVNLVKQIDGNDELWKSMIQAPWQTNEQIARCAERKKEYFKFFINIFNQPLNEAVRKPEGCFPDMYRYQFFNYKVKEKSIFFLVYHKIKSIIACYKKS